MGSFADAYLHSVSTLEDHTTDCATETNKINPSKDPSLYHCKRWSHQILKFEIKGVCPLNAFSGKKICLIVINKFIQVIPVHETVDVPNFNT